MVNISHVIYSPFIILFFCHYIFAGSRFACYLCDYGGNSAQTILQHCMASHNTNTGKFSLRTKILCHKTGQYLYKSVHFPITIVAAGTSISTNEPSWPWTNTVGKLETTVLKMTPANFDTEC